MRRIVKATAITILLGLALSACVSSGPQASGFDPEASSAGPKGTAGSAAEAKQLMDKATEFMDAYKLTEAIKAYVAVLAIAQGDGSPEVADYATRARTELTKIGTTLTIEPSPDWMDAKGNQVSGVTRDIGKPDSLSPGVYLYQNMGSSKSPLPDAPIFFEFVKNSGSLNVVVATDAFGKATTVVSSVADVAAEAVVRAYPVFTVRGFRYAFSSVQREFTYLPPTNAILVAALETSEFGARDSAESIDAIALDLKSIGYEPIPFNAKLDRALFLEAYGGDAIALRKMGGDKNPSYFAFAFVECYSVKQGVYEGVSVAMFFAYTRATVRIVRSDGAIVYSTSFDVDKAAGSSANDAVAKSFILARKAVSEKLKPLLPEIKAALAK